MPRCAFSPKSLAILAGLCLVGAVCADVVTVDYTFAPPQLTTVTLGGETYDAVTMVGAPNGGDPGEPNLPARGARILLPLGTEVVGVEVLAGSEVLVGTGYHVEPVGPFFRLSEAGTGDSTPRPDPAIYGAATPFPPTRHETVGTQAFRGYQILVVKLNPVRYEPVSGTLHYYPRLTVRVATAPTGRASPLLRNLPADQADVLTRVDNPDALASYAAAGTRGARSYDLLILSTPQLGAAFTALRDYHNAHGLATEIRTTNDVGSTDPDVVREYIRQRYLNDGISYVLIGGDDDLIPAKDLYVEAWSGGDAEFAMPADIYFGCLDGTYNYDGDNLWGEPTDGPGGGDVDLMAEVYVGRACVGVIAEVQRFTTRTLWYLEGQHRQPKNVLLVGEHLGFGGIADYAGNTLDELIDGCSEHGYTTVGIPSYPYEIETLYERDYPWSTADLVARINGGVHLINHLGHGNADYAMKMYSADVLGSLTNPDYFFVYSQTCTAGHFDAVDCWAEHAHIKSNYGAFAAIMNARYGWGSNNTTDGPSQRFNREFWDAVFNPAENMPQIARANHRSKEENLYRIDDSCMRWITYELNVFGDPTIAIQPVTGLVVTPRAVAAGEGTSGGPFAPDAFTYTLHNLGPDAFDYEVLSDQPWMSVANATGTIAAGASADVVASFNAQAATLPDGLYVNSLVFLNTTGQVGDTGRLVELKIGTPQVAYAWNMDTNPNWVTQGEWAWGQPQGGGGTYGNPDPTSGHTGANVCGYNLSGDYANNLPEHGLTTSAIDCTYWSDVKLRFWRWLGVEDSGDDHAAVKVSPDGLRWTTIWENSDEVADGAWVYQEFDISDIADNQARVFIRWTLGPTDGSRRYCGWNLDDVEIFALPSNGPTGACCYFSGACTVETQTNCSGTWMGAGTGCLPNNCPRPSGACCDINGGCTVRQQAECQGIWLGPGTSCSPNQCPQPPGACCYYYTGCAVTTEDDCVAAGGVFEGPGTGCTPDPCPPPPTCAGDANCDTLVNWRDIDFFVAAMNDNVAAWTALFGPESPLCQFANNDANGDGTVNWRDIDALVAVMNTACP